MENPYRFLACNPGLYDTGNHLFPREILKELKEIVHNLNFLGKEVSIMIILIKIMMTND